MPNNSADLIRSLYQAFGRGDVLTVLSAFDPTIEWNEAENFAYADGNPYIGPDKILQGVFMRLGQDFQPFAVVPHDFVEAGDRVIVFGRYQGKSARTGTSIDAQFVHAWWLRDGKVVRFQQYTDTAQFARAAQA